jgi:hypothetical protein
MTLRYSSQAKRRVKLFEATKCGCGSVGIGNQQEKSKIINLKRPTPNFFVSS